MANQLQTLGAGPGHTEHLLRQWALGKALDLGTAKRRLEHYLPASVRAALPALSQEWAGFAKVLSTHPGADGSQRLLVGLADGQTVEAVLLPREGLCISSQVGCAVGCRFCMTGVGGLQRQLGSAEMVAQFILGRRLQALRKVVFMGMGEPAHNLEAVLEAIQFIGTLGGIAHKQIVFSTVGDARAFARLPHGRVKPALALSLHSLDAATRAELLPRAPRIRPQELVREAMSYAETTGYPLQVQWTLLDGVNDQAADIEALEASFARRKAVVNLIPWNEVDGLPCKRPPLERIIEMGRALNRRGVFTRLRQSAGQDVQAGCGQLRSRSAAGHAVRVALPASRVLAAHAAR